MLTQSIENLLNRNLAQSPRARELCRELTDKRLRITAVGPGWQLDVVSLGTSLQLTSRLAPDAVSAANDATAIIHATIEGTPLSLGALAATDAAETIRRGDVRIGGDAEIAQRFQQIFRLLRPDTEEELSRLIGDSPAQQILRLTRGMLQFGQRAARTTVRNTAEFFAHESQDLVPTAEAQDLYQGVDRLREDVDRIDARIAVLTRALEPAERSDG
ncbi:MAG TPA: hypothetical protein P5528_01230 [Steroidobacteraceae bacterium]|nr:hypothetical protein [Steroidobacteraceae bacterium]HRX88041.1 hypothetical protein [Steroidobacteraceae bacterium]